MYIFHRVGTIYSFSPVCPDNMFSFLNQQKPHACIDQRIEDQSKFGTQENFNQK